MTLALTLKQTDEICRSAESAVKQLRLVDDGQGTAFNALNTPLGWRRTAPTAADSMILSGESCVWCHRRE